MIPVITGAIGIITAAIIVILIRRDRLHVRFGLWWMTTAITFALLGFSPGLFDRIARSLDVSYPPTLVLLLAIVILVIKILMMDIEESKSAINLNRLAQRIALLESKIPELPGHEDATREKISGDKAQED